MPAVAEDSFKVENVLPYAFSSGSWPKREGGVAFQYSEQDHALRMVLVEVGSAFFFRMFSPLA